MKIDMKWTAAVVAVSLAVVGQVAVAQDTSAVTITTQNTKSATGVTTKAVTQNVFGKDDSWVSVYAPTAADEKRVNLDLDRASLKDALRQLFDQAKHDYSIDGDVPDASITVHAKNVRFSTALELITEAAGIHWRVESRDRKAHYTVGKS